MAFVLPITVAAADVDELDHVSNLVYLRWVQEAAVAHSDAVGLGIAAYLARRQSFVVRSHQIDYLRPALSGERLEAETRVVQLGAASSTRQTEIRRAGGGEAVARAVTGWAYLDLDRGRPTRIPEEVRARFQLDAPFAWSADREAEAHRRAEEELRRAVAERDTLLAEIHHRVKNNLQVISSLLTLQASHVDDERLHRALEESQQRVRSMALVHEHLYRSRSFSSLDLGEHLRSLVAMLAGTQVDLTRVALAIDVPSVRLGMRKAIPLGLIVTELLSNAFRHAFPGGRRGTVSICGQSDGESAIVVVQDDGVGLPPGFDPAAGRSLGLKLARSLARQIDGELTLSSGDGTEARLEFKVREQQDR